MCIPKLDLIIQTPFSSFFYKEFHRYTSNTLGQQFFPKNSKVALQFVKFIKEKRIARMKAQTRSPDHPLIKAVNEKMADLKKSQRAL